MALAASVVICSRNRPRLLAETVESVLAGDEVPAEIVIVDESDTPAAELIPDGSSRGCHIRHLTTTARGLSWGRNAGAAAAAHDLLVFTDDDMTADPQWIPALVGTLSRAGSRDVVTGRVLPGGRETPGGFVPALAVSEKGAVYSGRLGRDVLAGGNMAIRRALFETMGGFDVRLGPGSRFPAAEDNDLGFRLLEAGGRILYVPEALLYHRAWRPASAYLPLRFAYGRGKGGFYAKNVSFADRYMLGRAVVDVVRRPFRAARLALHPRLAAGEIAYGAGVIRGAAEWVLARGRVDEPDAELASVRPS